jgi:hypothetical protein
VDGHAWWLLSGGLSIVAGIVVLSYPGISLSVLAREFITLTDDEALIVTGNSWRRTS